MNFPTWPCSYPEKTIENNNSDKKLEKRIFEIQPTINLDFDDFMKSLFSSSSLNSFNKLQKPPKLIVEKLAKGSYVAKIVDKLAAEQPSLFEGTNWDPNYSDPHEPF